MAQIICEVSAGMRDSERTITVRDVHGRKQFLRVEEGFVAYSGQKSFLPIGVVAVDDTRKMALVELPHEADSGTSRLWVRLADVEGLAEVPS